MLTFKQIKSAIIDSLSPELLTPQYRAGLSPDDPVETGHCAVASEAFYYLAGGKEAGFMPVVCGYSTHGDDALIFDPAARAKAEAKGAARETHWWIKGQKNGLRGAGDVFDVTAGQYPFAFPYENGRNTGFMQPQQKPSRRAQVVMDRVIQKLGAKALADYRRKQMADFQKAQRKAPKPRRAKHLRP